MIGENTELEINSHEDRSQPTMSKGESVAALDYSTKIRSSDMGSPGDIGVKHAQKTHQARLNANIIDLSDMGVENQHDSGDLTRSITMIPHNLSVKNADQSHDNITFTSINDPNNSGIENIRQNNTSCQKIVADHSVTQNLQRENDMTTCVRGTMRHEDVSEDLWIVCKKCSNERHNSCEGITTDEQALRDVDYYCAGCKIKACTKELDIKTGGIESTQEIQQFPQGEPVETKKVTGSDEKNEVENFADDEKMQMAFNQHRAPRKRKRRLENDGDGQESEYLDSDKDQQHEEESSRKKKKLKLKIVKLKLKVPDGASMNIQQADPQTAQLAMDITDPDSLRVVDETCAHCHEHLCPCLSQDDALRSDFAGNHLDFTKIQNMEKCIAAECRQPEYHLCCAKSVSKNDVQFGKQRWRCPKCRASPEAAQHHEQTAESAASFISETDKQSILSYHQGLTKVPFPANLNLVDMKEGYIKDTCDEIFDLIKNYDNCLRAVYGKKQLRLKIKDRDHISPLNQLPEIVLEERKLFTASTRIIEALRYMFDVKTKLTLRSALGSDVTNLPVSTILCSTFAYVLCKICMSPDTLGAVAESSYMEVDREVAQDTFTKESIEYYLQERALRVLKKPAYQEELKSKAHDMSSEISQVLAPIVRLIRPEDAELTELRFDIVHTVTKFAAELRARTGTFVPLWSKNGQLFNPTIHQLDHTEDLIDDMPMVTKKKQRILLTKMFGIKRDLTDLGPETYSRPVVILQKPYIDWGPSGREVKQKKSAGVKGSKQCR